MDSLLSVKSAPPPSTDMGPTSADVGRPSMLLPTPPCASGGSPLPGSSSMDALCCDSARGGASRWFPCALASCTVSRTEELP